MISINITLFSSPIGYDITMAAIPRVIKTSLPNSMRLYILVVRGRQFMAGINPDSENTVLRTCETGTNSESGSRWTV